MPILNRFRKPGGFQQLLSLLESCEPSRQSSLLHLIASEDPGWAQLIKAKMLTFDRVASWPVHILMEIRDLLPDVILVAAYQMTKELQTEKQAPWAEKWIENLPQPRVRQIQSAAESQLLSAAERTTATIKILQTVRELESEGRLRFSTFDPALEIDQQIAS